MEYDHYKSGGVRGRAGKKLKGRTCKNRKNSLEYTPKKYRVNNPHKSKGFGGVDPRRQTNQMKKRFNHYVGNDSNTGELISTETELNEFAFQGIKDDRIGQIDKNHEREVGILKKQKCRRDYLVI
mmetsp:Transcript_60921/g.69678  ORF Transcript_60921/g.69678 Transcript_60921/m.69678 type:complete len:125 (-) Transcript_60921:3526-3900(-)